MLVFINTLDWPGRVAHLPLSSKMYNRVGMRFGTWCRKSHPLLEGAWAGTACLVPLGPGSLSWWLRRTNKLTSLSVVSGSSDSCFPDSASLSSKETQKEGFWLVGGLASS